MKRLLRKPNARLNCRRFKHCQRTIYPHTVVLLATKLLLLFIIVHILLTSCHDFGVPFPRIRSKSSFKFHGNKYFSQYKVLHIEDEGVLVDGKRVQENKYRLVWNHDQLKNPAVTEQFFEIGTRHREHISVYKPLCLDVENRKAISFKSKSVCGGFNRSESWFLKHCQSLKAWSKTDSRLPFQSESKPLKWLDDHKRDISWIPDVTVVQYISYAGGNIAHYAGHVLHLHHVLENIASYSTQKSQQNRRNVLIIGGKGLETVFGDRNQKNQYHWGFLNAILGQSISVGNIEHFRTQTLEQRNFAEVVLNFSDNVHRNTDTGSKVQIICFENVIVPGYAKGRFFLNDYEYQAFKKNMSNESWRKDIPSDRLALTSRLENMVRRHNIPVSSTKKKIAWLDRTGRKRVFNADVKQMIVSMIRNVANEHNYAFNIIGFHGMDFLEQYTVMRDVHIAVGVHGANLVNSIFMNDPASSLIEILPYRFSHNLYVNAGNSGLRYFKYQLLSGYDYEHINKFKSIESCLHFSIECKTHYRDVVMNVTSDDLENLRKIIEMTMKIASQSAPN